MLSGRMRDGRWSRGKPVRRWPALLAVAATVTALMVPLSTGTAGAVVATPDAGQFVPLAPARVINTANGLGLPSAWFTARP
jgi:hypothetical protein